MSRSARTLYWWSWYGVVAGLALIVLPSLSLAALDIDATIGVWTRIVGLLSVVLGYYNYEAARHDYLGMIRASVIGRGLYVVVVVLLAVDTGLTALLMVAVPDLAGLVWTAATMRSEHGTVLGSPS